MEHFVYLKPFGMAAEERAKTFAENSDGKRRHVELRIDDQIYVHLYEDDVHIQTQQATIPERWATAWASGRTISDAAIKRYVRRKVTIGSVPIVEIDAR